MAQEPDKRVKVFTRKLRQTYPDARVLLFGSRARGDHLKSSDYDVVVISDGFTEKKKVERMARLLTFWDDHRYEIDILPYTNSEFAEWSSYFTIAGKAKEEGIEVEV